MSTFDTVSEVTYLYFNFEVFIYYYMLYIYTKIIYNHFVQNERVSGHYLNGWRKKLDKHINIKDRT